jgi:hypothetical protein
MSVISFAYLGDARTYEVDCYRRLSWHRIVHESFALLGRVVLDSTLPLSERGVTTGVGEGAGCLASWAFLASHFLRIGYFKLWRGE